MTQKEKNKTLIIPLVNVVLSVNGKQAQQVLSTLQRDASNLEKNIANATTQTSQSTLTSSVRRTALF